MKRLWELVLASKLSAVIRLAVLCTGLSLVLMVLLVIVKIPLFLVLGVGVAHTFGIAGVVLFAIAVIKESLIPRLRASSLPPAPSPKSDQSPGK
jgi:hypothetical protein